MLGWKTLRRVWESFEWRKRSIPAEGRGEPIHNRMAVLLVARNYSLRESLDVLGAVNGWDVFWAISCDEAIDTLKRRPVPLVICDEEAPEGWRKIVECIDLLPQPSCVLLASRFCDDALRAEATRCHAYDVIANPFSWEEVTDHVLFAWAWYTSGCEAWWGSNADRRALNRR